MQCNGLDPEPPEPDSRWKNPSCHCRILFRLYFLDSIWRCNVVIFLGKAAWQFAKKADTYVTKISIPSMLAPWCAPQLTAAHQVVPVFVLVFVLVFLFVSVFVFVSLYSSGPCCCPPLTAAHQHYRWECPPRLPTAHWVCQRANKRAAVVRIPKLGTPTHLAWI